MDKYREEGNPDQMGYPGEPLEDIDVISWSAYLDADLKWIESQPENKRCTICDSDNTMYGTTEAYGLELDCWSCVECGHNWGGDLGDD